MAQITVIEYCSREKLNNWFENPANYQKLVRFLKYRFYSVVSNPITSAEDLVQETAAKAYRDITVK